MKQAKLLLLFVVAFAILFAGCAKSSTSGIDRLLSTNPAASETEELSESSKSTTSKTEEVSESTESGTSETVEVSESPESTTSEAGKVSESTQPTTSEAKKALVSVDFATDELLSKYDSFAEFIEFEDDSYPKIIFTTNIAVKDFKFIEVDFKDEDMNTVFFENKILYSLEELSAAKPFVVTWMEQGTIPHRGISFIDETGTARYFYIVMSGEDGSLLLEEFKNE